MNDSEIERIRQRQKEDSDSDSDAHTSEEDKKKEADKSSENSQDNIEVQSEAKIENAFLKQDNPEIIKENKIEDSKKANENDDIEVVDESNKPREDKPVEKQSDNDQNNKESSLKKEEEVGKKFENEPKIQVDVNLNRNVEFTHENNTENKIPIENTNEFFKKPDFPKPKFNFNSKSDNTETNNAFASNSQPPTENMKFSDNTNKQGGFGGDNNNRGDFGGDRKGGFGDNNNKGGFGGGDRREGGFGGGDRREGGFGGGDRREGGFGGGDRKGGFGDNNRGGGFGGGNRFGSGDRDNNRFGGERKFESGGGYRGGRGGSYRGGGFNSERKFNNNREQDNERGGFNAFKANNNNASTNNNAFGGNSSNTNASQVFNYPKVENKNIELRHIKFEEDFYNVHVEIFTNTLQVFKYIEKKKVAEVLLAAYQSQITIFELINELKREDRINYLKNHTDVPYYNNLYDVPSVYEMREEDINPEHMKVIKHFKTVLQGLFKKGDLEDTLDLDLDKENKLNKEKAEKANKGSKKKKEDINKLEISGEEIKYCTNIEELRRPVKKEKYVFNYYPEKCTTHTTNDEKDKNKTCKYAHNDTEINYHPLFYKTRLCRIRNCKNEFCPNSHSIESGDFRIIYPFYDRSFIKLAQAIENHHDSDKLKKYTSLIDYNSEFDLNFFKTKPCLDFQSGRCNVDYHLCFYYHTFGERRRPYNLFKYNNILCDNISTKIRAGLLEPKVCKNGDYCSNAHGSYEVYYHPDNYKKKLCFRKKINNKCEFESTCYCYHNNEAKNVNDINVNDDVNKELVNKIEKLEKDKELKLKSLADMQSNIDRTKYDNILLREATEKFKCKKCNVLPEKAKYTLFDCCKKLCCKKCSDIMIREFKANKESMETLDFKCIYCSEKIEKGSLVFVSFEDNNNISNSNIDFYN